MDDRTPSRYATIPVCTAATRITSTVTVAMHKVPGRAITGAAVPGLNTDSTIYSPCLTVTASPASVYIGRAGAACASMGVAVVCGITISHRLIRGIQFLSVDSYSHLQDGCLKFSHNNHMILDDI